MKIPDEVRNCVAFIGYHQPQGTVFGATAFFIGIPNSNETGFHTYAVTAKHCIKEIEEATIDDCVYLRLNLRQKGYRTLATKIGQWFFHPSDKKIDVAVLPIDMNNIRSDHLIIPADDFITDERINMGLVGPGDDVFVTGLFLYHQGTQRNIPIIRAGNIAVMPEEPIKSVDKRYAPMTGYLIEARSTGGLSGSPVFVHCGTGRILQVGPIYLLGLMHGHWNWRYPNLGKVIVKAKYAEAINMGIGIVVPAQKILEVINQPALQEMRSKTEDRWENQKEYEAVMDTSFDDKEK